jgi:hypothetical protein
VVGLVRAKRDDGGTRRHRPQQQEQRRGAPHHDGEEKQPGSGRPAFPLATRVAPIKTETPKSKGDIEAPIRDFRELESFPKKHSFSTNGRVIFLDHSTE